MALPEPFGGFLLLAAIAVSTFAGVVVLLVGKSSRKVVFAGYGMIAAPWIFLAMIALLSPGIDEWNPSIQSDSDAWGTWEGGGYLIDLNADLTYDAVLKDESINGTWAREDWNLYLTGADGRERYMRFVEDSGQLILLPKPPRDDSPYPGPKTRKQ